MKVRLAALAAIAALIVSSTVWGSSPAQAHALLVASTPADGASVDEPPSEVLLTFTEAPDPALAVVQVLDASGAQVDAGKVEVVAGQPAQLRVRLPPLTSGTYTAAWRVTSPADGHTTAGAVAFGVGVPAVAAGTGGSPIEMRAPTPTTASMAGRWLFYVGVVVMLGAAVVGVAVVSSPETISRRALAAAWLASGAGVLVTLADQRASAQTSLGSLLSSSTGQRTTTQLAAVALAGVAVAWAWVRPGRWPLTAVGAGASAAMLARALAGHPNASSARWLAVGTQWIHLVSVGAWVGGLVWLLVAMRRGDRGRGPGLARRFSSVAAGSLAVVAVSGAARALDEVGAWSRLLDTRFGVTLLVKLGLFAALVAVGAFSRFRHVPAAGSRRATGGLHRAVRAEVAIAAGILGATAVLAGLPPSASVAAASRTPAPPAVTVTGNDYATSVRARLVVSPGSAGPNRFDLTVEDFDSGEPVPAETVSLRFRLQDRPDLAPTTLELTRDPDSHWRGSGNVVSISGRWSVTALVQTPTDAVEVPMELLTSASEVAGDAVEQRTCGFGEPDASYSVTVETDPDPPTAERTTFHLTVRRDGTPVTGAQVCIRVNMPDMQHPGVFTVASEAAAGGYDAALRFSMTGAWSGTITIAEPGGTPVTVPISFDVE